MQKIKETIEEIFETKVTVQDKIVKTTVKNINGNEITALFDIYCLKDVLTMDLKRSGTGITILVTLK